MAVLDIVVVSAKVAMFQALFQRRHVCRLWRMIANHFVGSR